MAEILSQSQIDDLLNELMGDSDGKENKDDVSKTDYKSYDFKSPKKLSREQSKVLSSITEVLGRHIASYLAGILRSYCEVEIVSVEEHPYYEYNNALPDTMMTAAIDIENVSGSFLLDMSNSLTFTLIERMLGGNIEDLVVPDRDFTEIEISICERIFKRICILIQESLQNLPDTVVTLRQIETNTRFIKSVRIEEIVEVVVYKVTIDSKVTGTISACIPYTHIEALLNALAKNNVDTDNISPIPSEESRTTVLNKIGESVIDVCAVLGSVNLSLRDISELQEGDVIKLDQKVGSLVRVTVNGKNWFWGEPGIKKYSKAVRLVKYFKDSI